MADNTTPKNSETIFDASYTGGFTNDFYVSHDAAVVVSAMNMAEDDCFQLLRVSPCGNYEEPFACACLCSHCATMRIYTAGRYRLQLKSDAPSSAVINYCRTAVISGMSCATMECNDMGCCGTITGSDLTAPLLSDDGQSALSAGLAQALAAKSATIETILANCIAELIANNAAVQAALGTVAGGNALATVQGIQADDTACRILAQTLVSGAAGNTIRTSSTDGKLYENDANTSA